MQTILYTFQHKVFVTILNFFHEFNLDDLLEHAPDIQANIDLEKILFGLQIFFDEFTHAFDFLEYEFPFESHRPDASMMVFDDLSTYMYDDEDISHLLSGDDSYQVLPIVNNCSLLKETIIAGLETTTNKFLVPFSQGGNHWVGFIIERNDAGKTNIKYFNSLDRGNNIPEEYVNLMQEIFSDQLESFISHPRLLQSDRSACGPLLVENFLRYFDNELPPESRSVYPTEISRIRSNHADQYSEIKNKSELFNLRESLLSFSLQQIYNFFIAELNNFSEPKQKKLELIANIFAHKCKTTLQNIYLVRIFKGREALLLKLFRMHLIIIAYERWKNILSEHGCRKNSLFEIKNFLFEQKTSFFKTHFSQKEKYKILILQKITNDISAPDVDIENYLQELNNRRTELRQEVQQTERELKLRFCGYGDEMSSSCLRVVRRLSGYDFSGFLVRNLEMASHENRASRYTSLGGIHLDETSIIFSQYILTAIMRTIDVATMSKFGLSQTMVKSVTDLILADSEFILQMGEHLGLDEVDSLNELAPVVEWSTGLLVHLAFYSTFFGK